MAKFVMPAWIAGIQARKDASGDIHVSLDSSIPCWNDVIEGFCFELTRIPPSRIFEGAHSDHRGKKEEYGTFVPFVVKVYYRVTRDMRINQANSFPGGTLETRYRSKSAQILNPG